MRKGSEWHRWLDGWLPTDVWTELLVKMGLYLLGLVLAVAVYEKIGRAHV